MSLIIYYTDKSDETTCRPTLNVSKYTTSNKIKVHTLDNYVHWTLIRCQIQIRLYITEHPRHCCATSPSSSFLVDDRITCARAHFISAASAGNEELTSLQ